jgi:hypothetical protein
VFVALGVKHAIRMFRVASSLACPLVQHFPHYLIHDTIFENVLLNIKCVFELSVQRLFDTFFTLRITERNIIERRTDGQRDRRA